MPLSSTSLDREPGRDPAWQIVANLRAGVSIDESFHQVFRTYHPLIERFFRARGCTPQESEDLAQGTFFNAFRGIREFRSDATLKTWLVKLAHNVWLNELRRRSTAKRGAAEVPLDDPETGEEEILPRVEASALLDQLVREEQRQTLLGELQNLPPQMRRCVWLRVVDDLSYREIAEVLHVSIQTVRSQLFQARKRLKERLEGMVSHD